MNMDDKTDVCSRTEKRVATLARFFVANKLTFDEFCENALQFLVWGGRKCWLQVILSLAPEVQSALRTYSAAILVNGYEPPARANLAGLPTEEEVNAKRAEMLPEYMALAQVIANHSVPK